MLWSNCNSCLGQWRQGFPRTSWLARLSTSRNSRFNCKVLPHWIGWKLLRMIAGIITGLYMHGYPHTGTHITHIYLHTCKHTWTQMYTTHMLMKMEKRRNYEGRLTERIAKMRPRKRKGEHLKERGGGERSRGKYDHCYGCSNLTPNIWDWMTWQCVCGSVLNMLYPICKDQEKPSNGHLVCYSWEYSKTLSGDTFYGDRGRQKQKLFCATAWLDFISVLYFTSRVESSAMNIRESFNQAISYGVCSRFSLKIPSNLGRFSSWLPKGLQSSSKPHITNDIIDIQVKCKWDDAQDVLRKEKEWIWMLVSQKTEQSWKKKTGEQH